MRQFGNVGNGPNEYNGAHGITFNGDTIIYDERNGDRLHKQHVNDTLAISHKNEVMPVSSKLLFANNKLYYLRGAGSSTHYILDNSGKKYFKQAPLFSNSPIRQVSNLQQFNNSLVFTNILEAQVFELNLETLEERIHPITSAKSFYDWKPIYNETRKKSFFEGILENQGSVMSVLPIRNSKGNYLAISISQKGKQQRLHLLNSSFETEFVVTLNKGEYAVASFKNKLLTSIKTEDGEYIYLQYSMKDMFGGGN